MQEKITWDDVYQQFKTTYPNLHKHAKDYRPYDTLQIKIWFDDGSKMIYDHATKCGHFVED